MKLRVLQTTDAEVAAYERRIQEETTASDTDDDDIKTVPRQKSHRRPMPAAV